MSFLFEIDEIVVFKKKTAEPNTKKHIVDQWDLLDDNTVCVINSRRAMPVSGNVYHVTIVNGKIPYTYLPESRLERYNTFKIKEDINDLLK